MHADLPREYSSSNCSVCDNAKPAPVPVPTPMGFDWAAAGIKPPVKTGWTCGVCSCQNTEKYVNAPTIKLLQID